MEKKYGLFKIREETNFPVWDILRAHIYRLLIYQSYAKSLEDIPNRKKTNLIKYLYKLFGSFLTLPFLKRKYVIFTASRYINNQKRYYDRSAISIIKLLKKEALVLEATIRPLDYSYRYNYCFLFRHFLQGKVLNMKDYYLIKDALDKCFTQNNITYELLNDVFVRFQKDFKFYYFILKILKPFKVFVSIGDNKAILYACKLLNIDSFLIQHSGIEKDVIEFSYPYFINKDSNIIISNKFLTYGDYWGSNLNFPTKIIPIGNDYLNKIPSAYSDNSILIISTIIHGNELKILTKEMALLRKDLLFNYKLHPNEYHNKKMYIKYFKDIKNVKVLSEEIATDILIAHCQLMVVIVSGTLYEALNQNKKVAIYKRIDYERPIIYQNLPNLFIVDNALETLSLLKIENKKNIITYYLPTNIELIKKELGYKK